MTEFTEYQDFQPGDEVRFSEEISIPPILKQKIGKSRKLTVKEECTGDRVLIEYTGTMYVPKRMLIKK